MSEGNAFAEPDASSAGQEHVLDEVSSSRVEVGPGSNKPWHLLLMVNALTSVQSSS